MLRMGDAPNEILETLMIETSPLVCTSLDTQLLKLPEIEVYTESNGPTAVHAMEG
jgi:nitrate reductase NapAB chaperone NapD